MKVGGETIQLSFGPSANAVTSHLCNLYGLACTSASASESGNANDGNDANDANIPLCDPYVTHAVQNETYVPRVLFVDGRNCFQRWPDANASNASNADTNAESEHGTRSGGGAENGTNAWHGSVEIHNTNTSTNTSKYGNSSSTHNNSNEPMNGNNMKVNVFAATSNDSSQQWNTLDRTQQDAFAQFQNVAIHGISSSSLSSSRYSASRYNSISSQFVYPERLSSSDGRTMNWDDEEEEEENDGYGYGGYAQEDDDENQKQRRMQAEQQRREREEDEREIKLHSAWDLFLEGTSAITATTSGDVDVDVDVNTVSTGGGENQQNGTDHDNTNESKTNPRPNPNATAISAAKQRKRALDSLQWMNYFMPPHPIEKFYAAPLPFDREPNFNITQKEQEQQSMLYSYQLGSNPSTSTFCTANTIQQPMTSSWRENVLSDKLRRWMEECDSVRGFQVFVDGDQDFFTGLGVSVLQELEDECRSAGRFSIVVKDGDSFVSGSGSGSGVNKDGNEAGKKALYWRSENEAVKSFRTGLNGGLGMNGITEHSDLILPISLSSCWKALHKLEEGRNAWDASAAAAMALETATLPYRLGNKARSKIGIGSGYYQGSSQADEDAFPTADTLSYHEFLSSMKPSNRHIVTELSGLVHPISPGKVHQALLQGTSMERKQMEEERNRNRNNYYRRSRMVDVDPGLWMEDYGPSGGIVSSLSPIGNNSSSSSRSMHNHFAFVSSLRSLPSRVGDVLSTYTTCLMEGMAVRYRPQCCVATVVDYSFQTLTGPRSHSAGSYWKNVLEGGCTNHTETTTGNTISYNHTQTLAVLGNSTRIHSHLQSTATGMKSALSRKYAGYLTRDGLSGLAPEAEDCEEAMEGCLTLRDVYEPSFMGFDSDEEGVYFEDNTD